ncbi:MAG TPA: CHAD domain-containing protein [Verrucomicrobiae bacterium]|nr:CHAD domain-containing protein [Verrucomicrobiae bacterium]
MPFQFKRKESVAKAVRRISRERLAAARDSLKDSRRLESAHNVRKEIKKLRALLRLVRDKIGRKQFRKNNRPLRRAAACLTCLRDAHVRLNAFKSLTAHLLASPRPFPGIAATLRESCREEEKRFLKSNSASAVDRILCKLARRARKLQTEIKGWAALGPGLRAGYARAREALAAAQRQPSPENLHDWRKRVKDLWYDLRLLCRAAPKVRRSFIHILEQLGEFLGDDHDLVMLDEFAGRGNFPARELTGLRALIRLRQKELRSKAMTLGARLLKESPGSFCARMERQWKGWRRRK